MAVEFIAEPITPDIDCMDTTPTARGEPAFPTRFYWRDRRYTVSEIIEHWAERSARYGEREMYTRKHWYRVRTDDGSTMVVYFERQARSSSRGAKTRWWLYSVES
jgi:hypothetical protein